MAPLFGAVSGGFAIATSQSIGGTPSAVARITGGNFDALIDFLATQNQATILAEPNLVAMSGETASFLAGGEIPVIAPQAGTSPAAPSRSTYKQVGISLAFTPTIVGDRINLKVAPEVSQVSTVGATRQVPLTPTSTVTVPAVQTRRASTTVELGSGQSFAIAGLLQRHVGAGHQEDAVAGRRPGARHALQVGRLSAPGDRAGDHRHALLRRADQRPAADADRPAAFRRPMPTAS